MQLNHEVPGDGPLNGILIIGDVPSKEDIYQAKPFVSPSGQILRRYCQQLKLEKVRFENVVEYNCDPRFDLYEDKYCQIPRPELRAWHEDLLVRIRGIAPKAIVVLGDTALKALTDHTSTNTVHCYVLGPNEISRRVIGDIPIISAFHPSTMMAQRERSYWLKFALGKALEVANGKKDPHASFDVSNDINKANGMLKQINASGAEICIDIETIKEKAILTAVGFSLGPDIGISISKADSNPSDWLGFISCLTSVLENPKVLKIGQNFMFDAQMLWKIHGIRTCGPVWDTMHCHNILYTDLKNALAEQGRLYFYHEPWKGGWHSTGEKLRIYNARDIVSTHRIKVAQVAKLKERNLYDYFTQNQFLLWEPGFNLACRGIRIDVEGRDKLLDQALEIIKKPKLAAQEWAKEFLPPGEKKKNKRANLSDSLVITDAVFEPKIKREALNEKLHKDLKIPKAECKEYYIAKKKDEKFELLIDKLYKKAYREEIELFSRTFNPGSPKQVDAVLKNAGVRLPKVKKSNTKGWGESTNAKALAMLLAKPTIPREKRKKDNKQRIVPDGEIQDFIQNMGILRSGNKLITSYLKAELDNGRFLCSYNIEGTKTGRSSTRQTGWKTGGNNQNIPRKDFYGIKFKNVFIPDPGCTMFQSDQEGAEARVVAYLCKSKKMIDILESGGDLHSYTASHNLGFDILPLKETDPEKFDRYRQIMGKRPNHAGNYNQGPVTMMEEALKDGVKITLAEATAAVEGRKKLFPEVGQWHKQIQETLQETRALTTPFGRRRFFFGMMNDALYRDAYSFVPQSTVPHITNLMWLWVEQQNFDYVQVLQMGHDALLMQVKDERLDEFIKLYLEKSATIAFKIGKYNVTIPWDAQIGKSWGQLKDWKEK